MPENPLLVMADIHGNAEALESVLESAPDDLEAIVVAGDVVGYGPQPGECVDRLRELEARTVLGNHDAALIGAMDRSYFNQHARGALRWQEDQLSGDQQAWLEGLSRRGNWFGLEVVHGSPTDPLREYLMKLRDFQRALRTTDGTGLVVGHTHTPVLVAGPERQDVRAADELPDVPTRISSTPYIVNPGSVGQPRDRDPRASYALLWPEEHKVKFCRREYDIEATQGRIRRAGYGDYLAERLAEGR